MSKYKLIGNYKNYAINIKEVENTIVAQIPLKKENGFFVYIENIINDLRKKEIYPTEEGFDILALAILVYLADTRICRSKHAEDSWTREIAITLPVYSFHIWSSVKRLFSQMLNFLTGDRWEIDFVKRENILSENKERKIKYDAVSLFSGGMDSLIGTINHLEQNHNILLVSHAGDGYTKEAQKAVFSKLKDKYPNIMSTYFNLWLSFGKDILLDGGTENSTRSRSFLFISLGIFILSGLQGNNVLQVPENGLIALNVPLDNLRIGSHSTRTTHPFYINIWNKILLELGLPYMVTNPYWNKTKGEMANECLNKNFLLEIISKSSSCSSPQKARWSGLPSQHCGYCVPCLIRRAAMHKAYGFKRDTTTYSVNSIKEIINDHAKRKGEQLRSFQIAIKRIKDNPDLKNILIYKGGRLDGDTEYINQLSNVYYHGLIEVDNFICEYLNYEEHESDK